MNMNKKEFYEVVRSEGLDKYNIGDFQEATKFANVIGYINDGDWGVYETNERGAYYVIEKYASEEAAIEGLLFELRNKKRKDDVFEKLNR